MGSHQDLRRLVRGDVLDRDDERREAASDFGRVVHRPPDLVVRPRTVDDVATVLRFASEREARVGVRSTAHSQGGQSLCRNGIVLDLSSLDHVLEIGGEEPSLLVEAGVTWHEVVERLRGGTLLPPVLTDNLLVSVAGTVAIAGLGASSFRNGPQAGLCTGLEVVTPSGEILWCDERENRELFDYARCGLGRFAVITKVRHPLVVRPSAMMACEQRFRDVNALLEAVQALSADAGVTELAGYMVPDGASGEWTCALLVGAQEEVPTRLPGSAETSHGERVATHEFFLRFNELFGQWSRDARAGTAAHPWVEAFVPFEAVTSCVAGMIGLLPSALADRGQILLWPIRHCDLPMLALPDGDRSMLVGFLASVSPVALSGTLDTCRKLDALLVDHGGKRYLSGWVDYGLADWRRHFGADWPGINRAKNGFDPQRILGGGFLTFEPVGEGADPRCERQAT